MALGFGGGYGRGLTLFVCPPGLCICVYLQFLSAPLRSALLGDESLPREKRKHTVKGSRNEMQNRLSSPARENTAAPPPKKHFPAPFVDSVLVQTK